MSKGMWVASRSRKEQRHGFFSRAFRKELFLDPSERNC